MIRLSPSSRHQPIAAAAALTLLALGGCNLFSLIDSPSGDAQLLSAARGCLDSGDYECAAEYYAELSDDMSDIRAAEAAFTVLDQVGVDMGAFIKSFVAGSADGTGFTILANEMISSQTPGQSLRKNIYENAYLKSLEISNKPLKGLVRFISSVALLSEILAETAGSDARFDQDDVASAGNDCRDIGSNGAACLTAPECGDGIPDTGATVDIDTTEPTGAVTLQMINAVIEKVFTAMGDDELGAGGSFGSTKSMADAVTKAGGQIGVGSGCYRAELLVQKFGYLKEE